MKIDEIRPEYKAKFRSCRFHREEKVLDGKTKRLYCNALNECVCLEGDPCPFFRALKKGDPDIKIKQKGGRKRVSKKKPCEWCAEEQFFNIDIRNCSGAVEVYPFNDHIAVIFQGVSDDGEMTSEDTFSIPMTYCPNCGRRLT